MANNIVNVCPAGDNDGSKIGKADKRWSEANVRAVATTEITFEASNPANTAGKLYFKNNKLYFNGIQLGAGGAGGGLDEDQVRDIAQQEIDAAKAGIKADIIAELDVPTQIADAVETAITNLTNDLPDIVVLLVQENNEIRTEITALIQDVIANSDIVQNAVEAALAGDALQNAVDTAVADLLASEELASVINSAINTFANGPVLASKISQQISLNQNSMDTAYSIQDKVSLDRSIPREYPAPYRDQMVRLWHKLTNVGSESRTITDFILAYPAPNDASTQKIIDSDGFANKIKAFIENEECKNGLYADWLDRVLSIVGPRLLMDQPDEPSFVAENIKSPKEWVVNLLIFYPFLFDFIKSDPSVLSNTQVPSITNLRGVRIKKFSDYPEGGVYANFPNTPVIEDPKSPGQVWLYRLATDSDNPLDIVDNLPAWQIYGEIFGNNCVFIRDLLQFFNSSYIHGENNSDIWKDTQNIYSLHLCQLNALKTVFGSNLYVENNREGNDSLDFTVKAMLSKSYKSENNQFVDILKVKTSRINLIGNEYYAVNLYGVIDRTSAQTLDYIKGSNIVRNTATYVGFSQDKDGNTVGETFIAPVADAYSSYSNSGEKSSEASSTTKARFIFNAQDFDLYASSNLVYIASKKDIIPALNGISSFVKALLEITIQTVVKHKQQITITAKDKVNVTTFGSVGVLAGIVEASNDAQDLQRIGHILNTMSIRNFTPDKSVELKVSGFDAPQDIAMLNYLLPLKRTNTFSDNAKGVSQDSIRDAVVVLKVLDPTALFLVDASGWYNAFEEVLFYGPFGQISNVCYHPVVSTLPRQLLNENPQPQNAIWTPSTSLPNILPFSNKFHFGTNLVNALCDEFNRNTPDEANEIRSTLAFYAKQQLVNNFAVPSVNPGLPAPDDDKLYSLFKAAKSFKKMFQGFNYLFSSFNTFVIRNNYTPNQQIHSIHIPLLYGKNFINGARITVLNYALANVNVFFEVYYPANIHEPGAENDAYDEQTWWIKTMVQDARYIMTTPDVNQIASNIALKVSAGTRKTFICIVDVPVIIPSAAAPLNVYTSVIPMLGLTIDSGLIQGDL